MKNFFAKLKQPKVFRPLITVLVIVAAAAVVLYMNSRNGKIVVEDSIISAPLINIVPPVPGKMDEMNVYENEMVKKGDPLMTVAGQTTYADANGLVVMANNQVGGVVSVQTPVIQIINPSDIRVAGTIDENKGLNEVKVGQVVSFTVDAYPGKKYWGYVDEVSPSAKQTQAAFSISSERPTQQFIIYARFDTSAFPEIKNGMSAKMTVFTKMP
jgi:multidrug resistance efflux pump